MATDNFDGLTAATTLAGQGSWQQATGAFQVVDQGGGDYEIHSNTAGDETCVRYNGAASSDDQYAEVVIASLNGNTGHAIGIAVRAASGAATYYGLYTDGAGNAYLFKNVAGTWTELGSDDTSPVSQGDVLRLEVNGTTLTPKLNGALMTGVGEQTDSAISSGQPGVAGYNNGTTATLDSWEGGNLGAGGDTTPPTLSSPTATATGQTTASLSVASDEDCDAYVVVTTSSTTPSAAQIEAGQDHTGSAAAYSDSQLGETAGTINFDGATGLTAGTQYWAHYWAEDAAENSATAITSSPFTTFLGPNIYTTYYNDIII